MALDNNNFLGVPTPRRGRAIRSTELPSIPHAKESALIYAIRDEDQFVILIGTEIFKYAQ
jgi:hypothetical protein